MTVDTKGMSDIQAPGIPGVVSASFCFIPQALSRWRYQERQGFWSARGLRELSRALFRLRGFGRIIFGLWDLQEIGGIPFAGFCV